MGPGRWINAVSYVIVILPKRTVEISMSEITKIEKLNGRNYQSWKYNVKLVLMERGLWGFTQEGQETPPETDASAAVRNAFRLWSDKAYSLIASNVEKDLQIHISSVNDPFTAWKTLQKQFEFVSVSQIVGLNRRFHAASMKDGADLIHHLTHMTSCDITWLSSKKFATVVLGSLTELYDNFLASWTALAPMISTGRMYKDCWLKNIWSGLRRKRNNNLIIHFSTEENRRIEEDFNHEVELVAVAVAAGDFRISTPTLSPAKMIVLNTKVLSASNATRMNTL